MGAAESAPILLWNCFRLKDRENEEVKCVLFSGIPFLYYFLPCVLILYFIAPRSLKNVVLLVSSLIFYAWGEHKYVLLMMASILWGYLSGLLIGRNRDGKYGKLLLGISIEVCVVVFGYFKYADFLITNFNSVTGLSVPLLNVALPIGISFYTFQILSYVIDVYRGSVPVQRNLLAFGTYVAMFPQLIAGPIVRYADIAVQLKERKHSFERVAVGIRRFVQGLGKKVLVANTLGELCNIFRASDEKAILFYWLYAVAFTLHIYFDFSGYSDMAIGLGKILGFEFMENFNYPYISRSITEFWRRWHISLGTWFRDYVYIPLGGNRVKKGRWLWNILLVWLLTGFWHGAAWNFIVWGLYFAVLLVFEKWFLLKYLKKSRVWSHIYVVGLVVISFMIFNGTDISEALTYIGAMLGIGDIPVTSTEFWFYLRSYGVVILVGIVGATPVPKKIIGMIKVKKAGRVLVDVLEMLMLPVLLVMITAYLVDGSFNPFLYFRF